MHKDCYNHKSVHAYELMICDILMECYKSKLYDFENDIFSPEKYMKLDDSLLDEVRCSDDENLQES